MTGGAVTVTPLATEELPLMGDDEAGVAADPTADPTLVVVVVAPVLAAGAPDVARERTALGALAGATPGADTACTLEAWCEVDDHAGRVDEAQRIETPVMPMAAAPTATAGSAERRFDRATISDHLRGWSCLRCRHGHHRPRHPRRPREGVWSEQAS